jgi:hypothetical protein
LAAFIWLRNKEPVYQGKRLSDWLLLYQHEPFHGPPQDSKNATAVRAIGTNALPFLIEWIQYVEPPWRTHIKNVMVRSTWGNSRLIFLLARPGLRAAAAAHGFQLLGTNASSAVPELTRVMNCWRPESSELAMASLAYLGKDALVPLLAVATNRNVHPYFRWHAVMLIGGMSYLSTNANSAIPPLIDCLQGPDAQLAAGAAETIGSLRLRSDLVVPALTRCLESTNIYLKQAAIESLGNFGQDARPAVPALLQVLRQPDVDLGGYAVSLSAGVRKGYTTTLHSVATNALHSIAPEVLETNSWTNGSFH